MTMEGRVCYRSTPCCQSSLLPMSFWMQLGMLRETQHLKDPVWSYNKSSNLQRDVVPGRRPWRPNRIHWLLSTLELGIFFHIEFVRVPESPFKKNKISPNGVAFVSVSSLFFVGSFFHINGIFRIHSRPQLHHNSRFSSGSPHLKM